MSMDRMQDQLNISPNDCSKVGIPMLPCDGGEDARKNVPVLAMAYVPMQHFRELYDHVDSLKIGTIFKELDLPFYGIGGKLL